MRRAGLAALVLILAGAGAGAHDGVRHDSAAEAARHAAAGPAPLPGGGGGAGPLPVRIEARFSLVDDAGRAVTEADFAGRPMAIFFGYANCRAICSVALPRLGAAVELLGETGAALVPVLITVDPQRDRVGTMGAALSGIHPRLVGLTGTPDALAAARAAFQVEATVVAEDPEHGPIYAHGSFIYLIGPDGRVLTLLPPVLGAERMAEIISGYL